MARENHGMSRSPTYNSWIAMKSRCTNPDYVSWHHYGGKGVRVCDRWMRSFEAFLEDMGPRPSKQHTIDRIRPDGDYEPQNCRWATFAEQQRTRSKVRRGKSVEAIASICRRCGQEFIYPGSYKQRRLFCSRGCSGARRRSLSQGQTTDAMRRRSEGESLRSIAASMGVGEASVRRALSRIRRQESETA